MDALRFTRTTNDSNGNPRYILHFLQMDVHGWQSGLDLPQRYTLACKLANTIGGKRFHCRRYGGGIVFRSFNLDDLTRAIARVTGRPYNTYTVE